MRTVAMGTMEAEIQKSRMGEGGREGGREGRKEGGRGKGGREGRGNGGREGGREGDRAIHIEGLLRAKQQKNNNSDAHYLDFK